jgi:hypothetical protein
VIIAAATRKKEERKKERKKEQQRLKLALMLACSLRHCAHKKLFFSLSLPPLSLSLFRFSASSNGNYFISVGSSSG